MEWLKSFILFFYEMQTGYLVAIILALLVVQSFLNHRWSWKEDKDVFAFYIIMILVYLGIYKGFVYMAALF